MSTLSLMPWIISREWTNDGKIASGAKIYTYDSGTNTPRATYKTADGSVLNTNPVICDASGAFTIFLGTGAYRIKVCDSNDVQIMPPIDGVLGAGSGGISSDSTSSATLLQTYAELRSLLTTPDLIYVAGRSAEGDGGQGWFQYIPTATDLDDDAIILTSQSGSKVYKRIFDGVIDPRWAGVVYNVAIDQTINFNKNTALSVKYGLPVLIAGNIYLNQNVTIPDNATIQMADTGYFTSTLSITMTFVSGSVFLGSDRVFGQAVQPKFEYTSVENIKLSWMAGNTDDERVTKWVNASSVKIPRVLDTNITISTSVSTSADILATTSGLITYTSATTNATISATFLNSVDYLYPIFNIHPLATISSINLNTIVAPEWFGSKGDGSDETNILKFVFKNSVVNLKNTYFYNGNLSISSLKLRGVGSLNISSFIIFGNTLDIQDISIQGSIGYDWLNVTNFFATNSTFPSTLYTISGTKVINGCSWASSSLYPNFNGTSGVGLYNTYLPQLQSRPYLSTDASGKIVGRGSNVNSARNWNINTVIGPVNNIKYANGVYFMLGDGSKIYTSTTGNYGSWTLRNMPNGGGVKDLYDVCWTGTNWVITGDFTILKSTGSDLSTWSFVDIGTWYDSGRIRACASNGAGVVIAVGEGVYGLGPNTAAIARSTNNGASWSVISYLSVQGDHPNCVKYADNKFVIGGCYAYWYSLDDGANFTKVVPEESGYLVDTIYGIEFAFGNWFFVGGDNLGTGNRPLLANSFDITNASYWNRMNTTNLNFGNMWSVSIIGDTLVSVSNTTGNILITNNINTWTPIFNPSCTTSLLGVTSNGTTGFITGASVQLKLDNT